MSTLSKQERRRWVDQAIANTRIEGHVPAPAFLADCERFVRGEVTTDEIRAASLRRAREADRAAVVVGDMRDAARVL